MLQPPFQLPFLPASGVLIYLHSRAGVRDCSLAIASQRTCTPGNIYLCVLSLQSSALLVQQPAVAECHLARLRLASLVDRTSRNTCFSTGQERSQSGSRPGGSNTVPHGKLLQLSNICTSINISPLLLTPVPEINSLFFAVRIYTQRNTEIRQKSLCDCGAQPF